MMLEAKDLETLEDRIKDANLTPRYLWSHKITGKDEWHGESKFLRFKSCWE